MPNRYVALPLLACLALLLGGCPKGNQDFKAAKRAEALKDYDTALVHYERALRADPLNIEYRLKATRIRFETGQFHVRQGQQLREKGELQLALAEFQKAMAIDPSSAIADQETQRTVELIASRAAAAGAPAPPAPPREEAKLMEKPPELAPISRAPINLKMTNDARIIFETLGKLAGLTVIFDPEFPARRIATELTNATLEQALDVVALQSKAFWKPLTNNIIFVVPEQPQKRRDYEEQVVRTFYVLNIVQTQELTEIVTGLRQLLDLKRIQQVNSQNAIIVRDTPDKLMLAEKLIRDIDKAKPEVLLQVAVLQARHDRVRDLGIRPDTTGTITFTPRSFTGTAPPSGGTGTGTAGPPAIPLKQLQRLSTADYSVRLPSAVVTALLTDSATKIIQNPEIRVVDGQQAKLRVGDRVPVATGSFQAGVGVGTTGAAGGFVNPLVNTQFQYIDVGVNLDITPHIHASREISMKVSVEVSSVTGRVSIGGIEQPIISQRKIDHDVRLQEGEANILGGLIERTDTKTQTGWPGMSKLPWLRYFFSGERIDQAENEVLIVLTPRIVRLPQITEANLRTLSAGTDTNIQVRRENQVQAPPQPPPPSPPPAAPAAPAPVPKPAPGTTPGAEVAPPARLRFEPQSVSLKPGETATIAVVAEGVRDLFSIPMLLQYDPAVVSVEEVRHGGFLSGGTQEIAIVQRVDKERGQAIISATRQPNTPGVNGTGTLLGIVIRGVTVGSSTLAILQANARDSQQKPLALVTGEASIRVE